MNRQEAIDIMKIAIAEVEWNYPLDYAIAFEEAIKALEKQIPKKVKTENGYFECPYCQTDIEIDKGKSYCVVCGQALDWSDTK